MRRATLLLLLAGCLNPDDIFPVHGTVDGPGQRVTLLRGTPATVMNLDQAMRCEGLRALKELSADETGAYTFDVFRAQAQNLTTFESFCFEVHALFDSGTLARASLPRLDEEQAVPHLADWRAGLRDGGPLTGLTPPRRAPPAARRHGRRARGSASG